MMSFISIEISNIKNFKSNLLQNNSKITIINDSKATTFASTVNILGSLKKVPSLKISPLISACVVAATSGYPENQE